MTRSESPRLCRPLIVAVISCVVLGTIHGVIAQTRRSAATR